MEKTLHFFFSLINKNYEMKNGEMCSTISQPRSYLILTIVAVED